MTFAHPYLLLLMTLPLALLAWHVRGQTTRLVLPFDHGRSGAGAGWVRFRTRFAAGR